MTPKPDGGARHTPGPITIDAVTGGYALRAKSVGRGYYSGIGHATQRDPHPDEGGGVAPEVARANALLWAASPDLLAACEALLAMGRNDGPTGPEARELARAAIAKARAT